MTNQQIDNEEGFMKSQKFAQTPINNQTQFQDQILQGLQKNLTSSESNSKFFSSQHEPSVQDELIQNHDHEISIHDGKSSITQSLKSIDKNNLRQSLAITNQNILKRAELEELKVNLEVEMESENDDTDNNNNNMPSYNPLSKFMQNDSVHVTK